MVLNLLVRGILSHRTCGIVSQSSLLAPRILAEQIYENNKDQSLVNHVQVRGAARKGKRIERARLARIRANKRRLLEAQNPKPKKSFKKNIKIDPAQFRFLSERQLDTKLPELPSDNVLFFDKFRRKRFCFDEIIQFHRQAVHPDVLNQPDALVQATVELNLKMKIKKKKHIEKIESTVCLPHLFPFGARARKIVALCKEPDAQVAAKEAGAIISGSSDVAALLKSNQLTQRDFDHIVCHTDFLVDFAAVKGMKGQGFFPNKQRGNYGDNIVELVNYFKNGLDYSLRKDPNEPEYGFIDCYFGRLNMSDEQLKENLTELFRHISRFKPLNLEDGKQFFERVTITTPATEELFMLKFWELTDEYIDPDELAKQEEEKTEVSSSG